MQQAAIYAGSRSPVLTFDSWLAYAGRNLKAGLPKGPAPQRPPSFPDVVPDGDSMARYSLAQ